MAKWRYFRMWLGRSLMMVGYSALPHGRVKTDLHERLTAWSMGVYAELAAHGKD